MDDRFSCSEPSEVFAEQGLVLVEGPEGVAITLPPAAEATNAENPS